MIAEFRETAAAERDWVTAATVLLVQMIQLIADVRFGSKAEHD